MRSGGRPDFDIESVESSRRYVSLLLRRRWKRRWSIVDRRTASGWDFVPRWSHLHLEAVTYVLRLWTRLGLSEAGFFQPAISSPQSSPKWTAVRVRTMPAKLKAIIRGSSDVWAVARKKLYTSAVMLKSLLEEMNALSIDLMFLACVAALESRFVENCAVGGE